MKKRCVLGRVRIQTGVHKGLSLWTPQILQTRPTPAKVREAFANVIAFQPLEERVLVDLFAGSGATGFEALSRGVGQCWFLESHPEALTCLKWNQNLKEDLVARSEILPWRFPAGFQAMQKRLPKLPRMVFADPPYGFCGHDQYSQEDWNSLFGDLDGDLFWQREKRDAPLELPSSFVHVKTYSYGRHILDHFVFRAQVSESASTPTFSGSKTPF